MMNETEKRRRQLLEQTRRRYSEYGAPPAVHPRYGAAYHQLYGSETEIPKGTFGFRAFLCFLLFTAFVAMDYKDEKILNVGSSQIVDIISEDLDVAEVWENL